MHESGIARYLDGLARNGEEIGCLAPGGGTEIEDLLAVKWLLSS